MKFLLFPNEIKFSLHLREKYFDSSGHEYIFLSFRVRLNSHCLCVRNNSSLQWNSCFLRVRYRFVLITTRWNCRLVCDSLTSSHLYLVCVSEIKFSFSAYKIKFAHVYVRRNIVFLYVEVNFANRHKYERVLYKLFWKRQLNCFNGFVLLCTPRYGC